MCLEQNNVWMIEKLRQTPKNKIVSSFVSPTSILKFYTHMVSKRLRRS
jgi:hypothetical protein